MPTVAATLSLNVPAITGLVWKATSYSVINALSSTVFEQGTTAFTNLTSNSGYWQQGYTNLTANSSNWNASYTALTNLS